MKYTKEGFENVKDWAVQLAAATIRSSHDKKQIVLGLEPTDHYWFFLATWIITNGIGVGKVKPYAVKQTKEHSC